MLPTLKMMEMAFSSLESILMSDSLRTKKKNLKGRICSLLMKKRKI